MNFDTKKIIPAIFLIILAGIALFAIPRKHANAPTNEISNANNAANNNTTIETQPEDQPEVVLDAPQFGDLVASPMLISGKARGNWFFEGNIPVTLKDENGKVLVQKGVMVSPGTNWMTEGFVPFSTTLTFDPGDSEMGVLIIEKDNPSGLPENDASYAVPVRFK